MECLVLPVVQIPDNALLAVREPLRFD